MQKESYDHLRIKGRERGCDKKNNNNNNNNSVQVLSLLGYVEKLFYHAWYCGVEAQSLFPHGINLRVSTTVGPFRCFAESRKTRAEMEQRTRANHLSPLKICYFLSLFSTNQDLWSNGSLVTRTLLSLLSGFERTRKLFVDRNHWQHHSGRTLNHPLDQLNEKTEKQGSEDHLGRTMFKGTSGISERHGWDLSRALGMPIWMCRTTFDTKHTLQVSCQQSPPSHV